MEKEIKIKTSDHHLIYGVLNSNVKSNKLIIFVHGLTGHKNEQMFYNAASFFPKNNFNTFRFDLYTGEKKGRKLEDCSLETHSNDLNTVVNYFKNKFNEIYLVGHSLGGPTILWADQKNITSIVFWDPSFGLFDDLKDDLSYDRNLKKYILNCGTSFLLSKEQIADWKKLDERLLGLFHKSTKIIFAGKGVLQKRWKKLLSNIKQVKTVTLKEATHCFDEENLEEKLFQETLRWFSQNDL